jgi:type I restriction enzyme S subunit
MKSSFVREPIGSLLEAIIDNRGKTVPTSDRGIPLIATNCIKEDSLYPTFENIRYVSKETHETWFRAHLLPEDILFVNKGTPGRVCMVPDPVNFCAAQDMIGLRADRSKVYPRYLFSFLRSDWAKEKIRNYHVGLAIPHFKKQDLDTITVPRRSTAEQKAIGDLYFLLSEKIELNNQINAELEGVAKLLYDYWFVQFDFPITADQAAAMGKPKLEGKPYRASGGNMVYNEKLKREIPAGWGCVALGEFEPNIITGKTPPTSVAEYYNGDIPFICIGDVRGNMHVVKTGLTLSKLGAETQKKKYIPKGAICVTCIASPGLIAFATENSQTNQQLNSVVCQRIEHRAFLYFELNQFFRFSSGAKTGNTFANMSKGDFSEILVLEPPNKVIQLFHELISSNIELVLNNSLQNQELTKLRDWLLPMLMNGQVTVA